MVKPRLKIGDENDIQLQRTNFKYIGSKKIKRKKRIYNTIYTMVKYENLEKFKCKNKISRLG